MSLGRLIWIEEPAQAVTQVHVRPDGTGDYLSPKLANDGILDASRLKVYEVIVHPGTYTEVEWVPKPYVRFIGTDRNLCRLWGAMPDDASNTDISNNATLRFRGDAWFENLWIKATNLRYPIHDESANVVKNWTHVLRNCIVEHAGNQGARDWRDANPGNPQGTSSQVWAVESAYGYGSSSGGVVDHTDTVFISAVNPWGVHNNSAFERPNYNHLKGCQLVTTHTSEQALGVSSLGSGTEDLVELIDCELSGLVIEHTDGPWLPTDLAGQYADHSDYRVTLRGCNPVAWRDLTRGKALAVRSASTGETSTVELGGTAADLILGTVTERAGGGGLLGYAYGSLDISGILVGAGANVTVNNTLGRRLGNRTGDSKTLTMTFESGTVVTHTFDADHTNETNATILAAINATLGAHGTALEWNPSLEEYYPHIPDKTRTLVNGSAVGIPRFAAVTYVSNSKRQVRLTTSGDAASAFVGIALEPIPPGKLGRILTEGIMRTLVQLYGVASNINPGNALYLDDSTDGEFATTGTRQVGYGVHTHYTYFNGAGAV